MPRKIKHRQTVNQNEEVSESQAIASFLGDMAPVIPTDVSPALPQPSYQEPSSEIEDDGIAILRKQVMRELYGTEEPEQHDRELLTIKERMNRYGTR